MIRIDQYFGPYNGNTEITEEIKNNATELLESVNQLLLEAQQDGVGFLINPKTSSYISGSGNGGFRLSDSKVGASKSKHKTGNAVDIYDPERMFASWVMANKGKLADAGLYTEDVRWTPSWVHLQNIPPNSGQVVYRPSMSEPLASYPEPWRA